MNSEKIAAIILAAGSSGRMNGIKKEFQKLPSGVTVLESAVNAFASVPCIDTIAVAISANTDARSVLPPEYFSPEKKNKIIFVNGGAVRRASVYNALCALARETSLHETAPQEAPDCCRYVLIHDGARPWVSVSLIENIIAAVKKYGAVIPLLPLTDTPKELETENGENVILSGSSSVFPAAESGERDAVFIRRHLKRANFGVAQTPQAFKFDEILRAHEKAAMANDEEFTDDAEIWGKYCGQVAVIPGDPANRKITFKEDLS